MDLLLRLLGVFLHVIAAIAGGIVVGYLVRGNYSVGALNGGLSAGIAGLFVGLLMVYLNSSVGAELVLLGFTSGDLGLVAIVSAIFAFIVFFIGGAVGGLIGTFIAGKKSE